MSSTFKFNPEINTGHILVCISVIGSCFVGFVTMKGDINSLKSTVTKIETKVDAMEEKVNSVYYKSKP
jgi:hypothetical protein